VRVSVRTEGGGADLSLVVEVVNGAPAIIEAGLGAGRRGGGTGLAGLEERVAALGGTFRAGRHGSDGWQVLAAFPLGRW
jgi:signal transduction histidine kinase